MMWGGNVAESYCCCAMYPSLGNASSCDTLKPRSLSLPLPPGQARPARKKEWRSGKLERNKRNITKIDNFRARSTPHSTPFWGFTLGLHPSCLHKGTLDVRITKTPSSGRSFFVFSRCAQRSKKKGRHPTPKNSPSEIVQPPFKPPLPSLPGTARPFFFSSTHTLQPLTPLLPPLGKRRRNC